MTIIENVPPFVVFLIGACLALITRGWWRNFLILLVPIFGAINLAGYDNGLYHQSTLFGLEILLTRVDKLSVLFGYLFHLAAFLGIIYSLHVKDTLQQTVTILYAGSALGAVFAGDLITLLIFWEILAVTSAFLIWARRTERSYKAATRYLIIQVISGLILLTGVIIYIHQTGETTFGFIGLKGLDSWLIFLAFGIKSAFPLLHNWLTDAYPESTETGTVFLSAFTTKVAVYSLARGYPGTDLLIYIGAAMTAFPIFFAVIENDLRRVLAYSLINQVGFMVCGIGIGTALAINGAVAHAFNDVIFKGLLFMTMGAVLYRTGKINGSDLGGLYKSMPLTTTFCLVGAASISAFPLFSGFVSKSMVMVSAIEEGHEYVWAILLFASAGVFHHAGIKIPFFAFFSHDAGIRCKEAPWNMLLAMGLASILCIYIGTFPELLYSMLPFKTDYIPYDSTHVIAQLQLLFFSAMAFVGLKLTGLYPPELRSVVLDAEWTYRKLLPRIFSRLSNGLVVADRTIREDVMSGLVKTIAKISFIHGPEGMLGRTNAMGTSVAAVAVMLVIFLVLNFSGI